MTIESFDIIFYTAIFVLPGFIINSFIDSINPSTKLSKEPYFLKCLLFSLCNCGVWSWLYIIVIKNKKLTLPWNWLLLLVISIVGSLIIGFILSVFKQKQLSQRFLSKFNIRTINSIPTAWDYYFSKLDSAFLIITLMDDTKLYGWYSTESFSSSNPEERDIYVELGYRIAEDGSWEKDDQSQGFYVSKNQIKYIEMKGSNDGQENDKN